MFYEAHLSLIREGPLVSPHTFSLLLPLANARTLRRGPPRPCAPPTLRGPPQSRDNRHQYILGLTPGPPRPPSVWPRRRPARALSRSTPVERIAIQLHAHSLTHAPSNPLHLRPHWPAVLPWTLATSSSLRHRAGLLRPGPPNPPPSGRTDPPYSAAAR